ncbi:MAG: S41 family peptidase [Paludibacteraceae bacterium]
MKHPHVILLIFVLVASISCRNHSNELLNPNTAPYSTPLEQFEVVWNGINNGYAFWDIDPTDWDSVYTVYKPRFEELSNQTQVPTATLQQYYADMCGRLIDHHMAVVIRNPKPAADDTISTFVINPGNSEVRTRAYYHERFSDSLLMVCIDNLRSAALVDTMAYCNTTKGSILACNFNGIAYLHLSKFMLTEVLNSNDSISQAIADVYRLFYDLAVHSDTLKGIILDQRGNVGGYVKDFDYVLAPFIDKPLTLGATRRKEGMARYDYSVWIPFTIEPAAEHRVLDVPIVALADINSASMGELTTYAVTLLPNGCFVGERTFGAHGPLFSNFEINYSGTFGDKNLQTTQHYVYMSNDVFRTNNGDILEGQGFRPNHQVLFNSEKMNAGDDVQLKAALDIILNNKFPTNP